MIRMVSAIMGLALLGSCSATITRPPVFAGGMGGVGGIPVEVPVASVIDRRFANVIRQRYDFSCGSAALATLLRYHYDYAVDEALAFRGMWTHGDRAQIRALGFSLLDMKRWLASKGLKAEGYRVTLDDIAKAGLAGIALIHVRNYRHFVVVKSVRAHEVLIGDPSQGLTVLPRDRFEAVWNGIYFVIGEDRTRAKRHFDDAGQWLLFARAPGRPDFAEPVSLQALALTSPFHGEF